ncbi:MAG: ZIP family metal transporter, partial [Microgenomates group bacterium]
MVAFNALLSVFIVSLISLIGAISLPFSEKRLQSFLIYFVSFSAGALLGDVFIHLLPEVTETAGFTLEISGYILVGIMTTFIIEKFIHWKHHADPSHNHAHPVT